jgi:class 3 adenylate cyclase
VNVDELIAEGFYDPDAPDAADRLGLLRLALEHGATVDEVRAAIDERRLYVLAAVRIISGGAERLTLDDAAARGGMESPMAGRTWRALGLAEPEPNAQVCTDADPQVFALVVEMLALFGEEVALQVLRTMGASLSRLADAEVAAVRSALEAPMRTGGGSDADIAQIFIQMATDLIPRLGGVIDVLHRHHIAVAGQRYSLWGIAPTEHGTTDVVVGFADLVGFTALSERLSTIELDHLVSGFEQRVGELASREGSRLVKLIGDEAMFIAGAAPDAADIAVSMLEAHAAEPDLPDLRIGLAAGEVLVREGDVFGPVVNLAARLVGLAEPGTILATAAVGRRLAGGGGFAAVGAGMRSVAGLDEPVEVVELRRSIEP